MACTCNTCGNIKVIPIVISTLLLSLILFLLKYYFCSISNFVQSLSSSNHSNSYDQVDQYDNKTKIMSFNIRYNEIDASLDQSWDNRKNIVIQTIVSMECDIIGLQEVMLDQYTFIKNELSANYESVYMPRDAFAGEGTPIFYNKQKWKLINSGTFWLSDTPDKPVSMTFGNKLPRIATWVKLNSTNSNTSFLILNTHYDDQNSEIRMKSSEVIIEKISKIRLNSDEIVIILGDFNAISKTDEMEILASQINLHHSNQVPAINYATYHGFAGAIYGDFIDHILISNEIISKNFTINPLTL